MAAAASEPTAAKMAANKHKLVRVSLGQGGAVVSHCCCCWPPPTLTTSANELTTKEPAVAINLVCEEPKAQEDSSSSSQLSNSLDELCANFRWLLTHNKVQYFYLGTLIYSVINLLAADQSAGFLGGSLALTLLLALVLARTTIEFGRDDEQKSAKSRLLRTLGLTISLLLLHLPLFRHLLSLNQSAAAVDSSVYLLGGLLYLLPGQLECLPLVAAAALSLSPLAATLVVLERRLWWSSLWPLHQDESLILLLLPVLGLLSRARWREQVLEEALEGADRLIEAKVSLEHQRQQQETLLLSVLPAYVAEQVKRNMLKKTTDGAGGTTPEELASDSQPLPVLSVSPSAATCAPASTNDDTCGAAGSRLSGRNSFLMAGWRQTSAVNQPSGGQASTSRRGFNELYIRTYNNVSLLYGDIVGFTQLCSKLSAWQLVRVLNDLFSHFDRLAEKHRIMRIKILGDCYYGVSGIPEFAVMGAKSRASRNDNHAINCVNMGLDMIRYIRRLNVERAAPVGGSSVASVSASHQQTEEQTMPHFELNMRIGIHTGHIHSGVIGLKKWQFDVWSNDVSIAMHCESSGVAGRIQVTQATVQQLQGAFTYERAEGGQRDQFLASKEIKTYLIKDKSDSNSPSQQLKRQQLQQKQNSRKFSGANQEATLSETDKIRAATLGTIREILLAGDTCNSNQHNSYGLALNHHDLKPFTLNYREPTISRLYARRPVAQLARQLSMLILVASLCLTLVARRHLASSPQRQQFLSLLLSLLLFLLVMLVLLNLVLSVKLFQRLRWKGNCRPRQDLDVHEDHQQSPPGNKNNNNKDKKNTWFQLTISHLLRLACWINKSHQSELGRDVANGARWRLSASLLLLLTFVTLHAHLLLQHYCPPARAQPPPETILSTSSDQLTVILALVAIDSSTQLVDHLTRCLLLFSLVLLQLALTLKPLLPKLAMLAHQHCDHQNNTATMLTCSSCAILLVFILWSWAHGRQLEYTNRANFLWRNRLNVDHEELEYISGINKVLLENILPSHVVQYYLTHPNEQPKSQLMANHQPYMRMSFSNIRNLNSSNELYHEQHDSVAVMFASIPHFYEFYDESDINKQGLGCIALLNEIICDFDKLLLKNKFSRIEKIKTIGSTYMAAAGLRPNNLTGARNSTASQVSIACSGGTSPGSRTAAATTKGTQPRLWLDIQATGSLELADERRQVMSQQKLNLICMIQFATSLMSALNGINKQSFQVFKLRVGVNAGPVVAGVIGAQRPFYDIWGDCVNIASRMESLGEVGRIQVEEQTAKLLMESLCTENYSIVRRGHINVKGKGGMVTYFVDKKPATNTFLAASNNNNPVSAPIIQEQDSHPLGKMRLPINNQLQRVSSQQGRQQQVEEDN